MNILLLIVGYQLKLYFVKSINGTCVKIVAVKNMVVVTILVICMYVHTLFIRKNRLIAFIKVAVSDQKLHINRNGEIEDHELECCEGVNPPVCSGLCFCFFLFFSFLRFFLASFSSSCLFCFLCFFS